MNSENEALLEGKNILNNMDLSLEEDNEDSDNSDINELEMPSVDVFETAEHKDSRITNEAFYASKNYAIHIEGFFKRIYPKDSEPYWKKIHNFFAIPYLKLSTARLQTGTHATETNSGYTGVRFLNNDLEVVSISLSSTERAEFTNPRSRLTQNDWTPPSGSDKSDVYKAFMEAAQAGYEPHVRPNGKVYPAFITRKTGYTNRGWVRPDLHIRSKHDLYVGKVVTQSEKMGDADIQKGVLREVIENSPGAAIFIAGTVAAFTKGRICIADEHCPIVNYVGEGEKGKSTTLRICASIEGSPAKGRMVIEGVSSEVGMESYATAYNNGPVFLDEIDERLRLGDLAKLVMRMTNGGGRIIHDADTTFRAPKTWNGMFFTTSNTSIKSAVGGDKKESAILTRLIEIDINDPDLHIFFPDKNDGGKVNEWMTKLSVNYGHIYDEVIEYIVKNSEELEESLLNYESQLLTTEELRYFQRFRRSARTLALVMLGADILSVVLGKESSDLTHEAINIYKNKYSQNINDEIDYADYKYISHLETLYSWINANKGMINWSKLAYAAPQEGFNEPLERTQRKMAQSLSNNAVGRGSILADIVIDKTMEHEEDFNGTIVLNAQGIKHLKVNAHLDFDELCLSLGKLGLVETKKLSEKKVKELGLSTTRTVRLILKPVETLRSEILKTKEDNDEGRKQLLEQANSGVDNINFSEIMKHSPLDEDVSDFFNKRA